MTVPTIAVIRGDGIGSEVIDAALQVLDAVSFEAKYVSAEAGYDCFQQHGTPLPEKTLEIAKQSDAILFGAITTPPDAKNYPSVIIQLRKSLNLFANLRPSRTYPGIGRYSDEGVDVLVVRENTEGLYVQEGKREGQQAYNILRRTENACRRIVHFACQQAEIRHRKLAVAHKANVVKPADELWIEVAHEVIKDHNLDVSFEIVDALCTKLIMNPSHFDVIVAPNFYGDILSDLMAGIVGSLGLCASANIGEAHALFEPVHGSAPDIAGQGIANPLAAILSAALMLRHLGEPQKAEAIEFAVTHLLQGDIKTPELGGTASTAEVTQALIDLI